MSFDSQLFFLLNNLAGFVPDALVVFFATYFPYAVIVAFVFFLAIAVHTYAEKIHVFMAAAASTLLAYGVVEGIRLFYHRPRPFITYHVHQLIPEQSWSFPSAHAITFFALATAVFLYNRKWGVCFFAAAAVIAVSRVVAGVHYPSDVVAGALLGTAIGYGVLYVTEKWLPTCFIFWKNNFTNRRTRRENNA